MRPKLNQSYLLAEVGEARNHHVFFGGWGVVISWYASCLPVLGNAGVSRKMKDHSTLCYLAAMRGANTLSIREWGEVTTFGLIAYTFGYIASEFEGDRTKKRQPRGFNTAHRSTKKKPR
jgi:hypothetical protein